MQNSRFAGGQCCRIFAQGITFSPCFNADQFYLCVSQKSMKDANGIGASSNTGKYRIRKISCGFNHLFPCFYANNRLQLSDQKWVGMRTDNRTNNVIGVVWMGHPITESLINGSAQCFIARIDRNNFGSKLQHPINIGRLSFYVHASHVDHTGNANTSTSSGYGNTVLTGSGFSNHSLCPETFCQ